MKLSFVHDICYVSREWKLDNIIIKIQWPSYHTQIYFIQFKILLVINVSKDFFNLMDQ